MQEITFKNYNESLNHVESFVDEICDNLNLNHPFYGNIIIALTEVINLLGQHGSEGRIIFSKYKDELSFRFLGLSESLKMDKLFEIKDSVEELSSDIERSTFMIKALCDNLEINKESRELRVIFNNSGGVDTSISQHRKDFLNKYLEQKIDIIR
ncbi:MAG: hypothetical protein GY834_03745 [Bacteroidetes bacterium]|nr:hypothetical protein [Bacteroidota bacterium]